MGLRGAAPGSYSAAPLILVSSRVLSQPLGAILLAGCGSPETSLPFWEAPARLSMMGFPEHCQTLLADSPSPELSSPSRSRAGSRAPDERELLGQLRKVGVLVAVSQL